MSPASLTLPFNVPYADVDRDEIILLPSLFKWLQEAAIRHANLFDAGTRMMTGRGESWVLNRLSAKIFQWPRFEDTLRAETWSSGIRGFRGYREFRVFNGDTPVLAASSLWLYVNLETKALTRVPPEILDTFPTRADPVFRPDLERLPLPPLSEQAAAAEISIRYSDMDANRHVNNTAYFDLLQTALARAGHPPRPSEIQIKFAREIPPETPAVAVRVDPVPNAAGQLPFRIELPPDTLFASGFVA
ncbi:MAG: hypothetical protein LBR12_06025 [Opitutaceae bacterium]|jgi:acyl-ACP thioesterase|nr:hypothetical protein [Opitutaceae bacterium]